MNKPFDEVKKNFGFGCMRLPMKDNEVDLIEFSKMIKVFLDNGFNYFDTAHPYINEKSEVAVRECLTKQYSRDSFLLANKLSSTYVKGEDSLEPLFKLQLERCGVDYFDFYLMHAVGRGNYNTYKDANAYEFMKGLKEKGLVKHIGFSFHDNPAFLEELLNEMPEMEFVQLQINYMDWENPNVESRKLYELAEKYNKPVVIMEPVKGGALVNLTPSAEAKIQELGGIYSNAGYAVRFAASNKNVFMVLSGMSDLSQMEDNVKTMKDFKLLTDDERNTLSVVRELLIKDNAIACTKCRYCIDGCPKKINIPELFDIYNMKKVWRAWGTERRYENEQAKASDCIKCGKCEKSCPQHLKIRDLLTEISSVYEK